MQPKYAINSRLLHPKNVCALLPPSCLGLQEASLRAFFCLSHARSCSVCHLRVVCDPQELPGLGWAPGLVQVLPRHGHLPVAADPTTHLHREMRSLTAI
eukprot:6203128-Pleurochrysis_carterae.AAC.4